MTNKDEGEDRYNPNPLYWRDLGIESGWYNEDGMQVNEPSCRLLDWLMACDLPRIKDYYITVRDKEIEVTFESPLNEEHKQDLRALNLRVYSHEHRTSKSPLIARYIIIFFPSKDDED